MVKSKIEKKELQSEVDLKEEQKFKLGHLQKHVSMFLKKFKAGKREIEPRRQKRGR